MKPNVDSNVLKLTGFFAEGSFHFVREIFMSKMNKEGISAFFTEKKLAFRVILKETWFLDL